MRTHDTTSQNTMKSTLYDKVLFYCNKLTRKGWRAMIWTESEQMFAHGR